MSTTGDTREPAALADARRILDQVEHRLAGAVPTPTELRTAVEGVHQVTTALATLAQTLMDQFPKALADQTIAKEVVADLRAMHGCLTTSTLLLAPALDDLRGMTGLPEVTVPAQQRPIPLAKAG